MAVGTKRETSKDVVKYKNVVLSAVTFQFILGLNWSGKKPLRMSENIEREYKVCILMVWFFKKHIKKCLNYKVTVTLSPLTHYYIQPLYFYLTT